MPKEKSEDAETGSSVPPVGDPSSSAPAPTPAAAAGRPLDPSSDASADARIPPSPAATPAAGEGAGKTEGPDDAARPAAAPWRSGRADAAAADAGEPLPRPGAGDPLDPAGMRLDQPAEPARTEDVREDTHEEPPEEDRGWSFAARALTFLVLLLAGAALGIWAAPRVAPLLPSGLAPVAGWLMPGQGELETRIAALEGELAAVDTRIGALPDADAVASQAREAAEAARTDIAGQIEALRGEIDEGTNDDAAARLGQIETTVEGVSAELAALKSQVAAVPEGLSADAAASIDTYRAELDGLRAEVGQLSGSVSALGARLDAAQADLEARAAEAEDQAVQVQQAATADRDVAAARADLAAVRAALASGAPFQEPLDRLAQAADAAVPEGLSAAAATGVATPAALRAGFSEAAHEAIRASIVAGAGDGLVARSRAFLEAQVASRSLTPREGASPDAVLSRVEDSLRRDDLDAALAEAEQLPSEAKAALGGWIEAARRRADAVAGLDALNASVPTLN